MNDRIKDLKKLAIEWGFKQSEESKVPYTLIGLHEKVEEKFAELIVEECVSQCWTVSEIEHYGSVISECSKRMRKHFGVE
jgi:hypothetical protein